MRKLIYNDLPENLKDYSFNVGNDGYYLAWNDTKRDKMRWEGLFEVPDPITFEHAKKFSVKLFQNGFSDFWRKLIDVNEPGISENGYIRPSFPFIKLRLVAVDQSKADYRRILGQFDLDMPKPELVAQISIYRDTLFGQMKRQAREAYRLNKEIAEVIKVFSHETGQVVNSLSNQEVARRSSNGNPLIIHDILQLFEEAILGGASVKDIQTYWIPEKIESNRFVSDQLKQATSYGLMILAKEREPVLQVAEQLARVILPMESLLEKLITGREFSEIDHARNMLPDPLSVADAFQKKAKNIVYDTEIIALAMNETREYILEHDLQTLNRHVEAIKRIVSEKIPVSPDPKTIRNWITTYGNTVFQGAIV